MMKKSGLIRFKKISIKTSMIVGFLIPVIVFAVVSIIITAYQTRLHQDEALKQQGAALTQIAYNINNSIENFTNSIHVLESNVLFNEFVSNSSSDFQFSPYKTANIINSFSHIKFTNNLFYELIIYNRKSDTVLTSNSIYKASDFFDTFNEFEKYPYSYWKDYTSPTQIQILGSSKIASFDNYHTSYLPVVFSNVLRNNTDCIIIGCIQKQTLDDLFSSLSKIPQADIYMLDSDTNFVFNWKLTDYINIDSSLKEKLLNTYEPQNTKINRDNYICISLNSQFPYFKDCTLLTAIPSSALNEYSKNTWLLSLCLITLAFMTACMIIIRNTKSFYSPIKEILNSAENVPLSGNEFDALKNIYSSFKNTQKNLYENISELLPIVCEQKTMQFITKSSSVDADDLLEYLKKII